MHLVLNKLEKFGGGAFFDLPCRCFMAPSISYCNTFSISRTISMMKCT